MQTSHHPSDFRAVLMRTVLRLCLPLFLVVALLAGCDATDGGGGAAKGDTLRELARARGIEIGAAVATGFRTLEPEYREVLAREFSMITAENAMKFSSLQPQRNVYNWGEADAMVAFAEQNDMTIRGHTLIWHGQTSSWVTNGNWSREEMIEIMREHITTVVGRYKGKIAAWDVVNEAVEGGGLRQSFWYERIGPEYIALAFQFAHEADPDALLFYNDYGAEGMGGKSDVVYNMVSGLVADGVPIHGVGLQMHVGTTWAPRTQDVAANMRRLGELGLQVHITEMDVAMPLPVTDEKLAAQAGVYKLMMETCLNVSACTAFVLWGFTDAHSWIPGFSPGNGAALIFDEEYQPKMAYDVLKIVLQSR